MSNNLKVAYRASIMSGTPRELLVGGTRLTRNDCVSRFGSKEEVARLIEQGYLIELGADFDPENPPLPPHTKQVPQGVTPPKTEAPITVRAPATPQIPVTARTTRWDLDPTSLTGKDVTELNIMISERTAKGQKIRKFETAEESAAWLSQDFEKESANIATG